MNELKDLSFEIFRDLRRISTCEKYFLSRSLFAQQPEPKVLITTASLDTLIGLAIKRDKIIMSFILYCSNLSQVDEIKAISIII